jgi:hypothetical protein
MDPLERAGMATKNLARTVIEGGRRRWNQFERRYSNRRARKRARQYAHSLRFDPDQGEGSAAPLRKPVHKSHYDRLAAAERWLASFVGRPWDDARAEMARRFDTRTIAGQHVVFDHLLTSVRGSGRPTFGYPDFAVDDSGILRALPRRHYASRWKLPPGKVRRARWEIEEFSRGRRIARRGSYLFWFEPTAVVWKACADRWCWREHSDDEGVRRHIEPNGIFRQTMPLTPAELHFWDQLPRRDQDALRFVFDRR